MIGRFHIGDIDKYHMRRYIDLAAQLDEALTDGPYAPLYHSTNFLSAIQIIKEDCIRANGWESRKSHNPRDYPGRHKFVSLTRSYQFATGQWRTKDVVFVLDQTRLRNDFRLMPFDYFDYAEHETKHLRSEAEEYLTRDIKPLSRYLTKILLNKDAENRLRDIIMDTTNMVTIDPSKARTLSNIKHVPTYSNENDPKIGQNEVFAPWLDRDVLLNHPLVELF